MPYTAPILNSVGTFEIVVRCREKHVSEEMLTNKLHLIYIINTLLIIWYIALTITVIIFFSEKILIMTVI